MTKDRSPILPGQGPNVRDEDKPRPQAPEPPRARAVSGEEPEVTFKGNSTDLSAVGALATSVLLLLSCLTCGTGIYCLPVLPLILGLVGLLGARRAVNEEQTRIFSWIGIGAGGLSILLILLAVVGYVLFVLLLIAASSEANW